MSNEEHLEQAQLLAKTGSILWRKATERIHVSDSIWELFKIPEETQRLCASATVGQLLGLLTARVDPRDVQKMKAAYSHLILERDARAASQCSEPIYLREPIVFKVLDEPRWFRLSYKNSFDIPKDPESEVVILVVQEVTELQLCIGKLNRAEKSLYRTALASVMFVHDVSTYLRAIQAHVSDPDLNALARFQDKNGDHCKASKALDAIIDASNMAVDLRTMLPERLRLAKTRFVDFDLKDLLMCFREEKEAESLSTAITVSIAETIPRISVLGDWMLLKRVFDRLYENSKDRAHARKIEITVDSDESCWLIRFSDDGPGYPLAALRDGPEDDEETELGSTGLGMGLTICYAIVSMHGGRITLQNDPLTKGAIATVVLPKHK